MIKQDRGAWFSATASGTVSATASLAATANAIYFITDIGCSSIASAGTFAVYGGTTILWEGQLANSTPYEKFFVTPLNGGVGNLVKIVANGTTATYANISAFQLNTT